MTIKNRKDALDLFSQLGYNVMFGKHYRDMGDYNEIRNLNDAVKLFAELGYNVEIISK